MTREQRLEALLKRCLSYFAWTHYHYVEAGGKDSLADDIRATLAELNADDTSDQPVPAAPEEVPENTCHLPWPRKKFPTAAAPLAAELEQYIPNLRGRVGGAGEARYRRPALRRSRRSR